MKTKIVLFITILTLLVLTGCSSVQTKKIIKKASSEKFELPKGIQQYQEVNKPKKIPEEKVKKGEIRVVNMAVEGLTCPGCALGLEYQLKNLEGVYDAKVDYFKGTAFAIYDITKLTANDIAKASTVYPAKVVNDEVYVS